MTDIRQWLFDLQLGEYAGRFEAEKVDLDAAIALTEEDLKELGVPMGPRKKLLRAIEALRSEGRSHSPAVPTSASSEKTTSHSLRRRKAVSPSKFR